MTVERADLADFLRARRREVDPEDVGLPRGPRRRTAGLRREEVAALAQMSVDYYTRLEQARGPVPSRGILTALADALRLDPDGRDHMFRLVGHVPPTRPLLSDVLSPGLRRVLERIDDTPAELINILTETLVQTPPGVALLGDRTHHRGLRRSAVVRWFTDTAARALYPEEDHSHLSRAFVSDLRRASSVLPGDARVRETVDSLLGASEEFAEIWRLHEVRHHHEKKRIVHPDLGVIAVHCQRLHDPVTHQALLVFTATPGSDDAEKLRMLAALPRRSYASAGS